MDNIEVLKVKKKFPKTEFDSGLNVISDKGQADFSTVNLIANETIFQKSNSLNKEIQKKEFQSELTKSVNDVAIKAFHNAAKESFDLGYPINIDLNGLLIKLNPDKTYEIIKTKEKELNTLSHIYL